MNFHFKGQVFKLKYARLGFNCHEHFKVESGYKQRINSRKT